MADCDEWFLIVFPRLLVVRDGWRDGWMDGFRQSHGMSVDQW